MRTLRMVLAVLFVFLAGFNVWAMLSTGFASARSSRLWTQVHRAVGYIFIALFVILAYFMLLRIKGRPDELSPQVALHMTLALALAPLLFAKVVVARYQQAQRGVLAGLGITIFAVAFTLVALNLGMHFLHLASNGKVSAKASGTFAAVVVAFASIAFLRKTGPKQVHSPNGNLHPAETSGGTPLRLVLAHVERQTHDAKTLRFVLPANSRFNFRPGQFLTFEWMIDDKRVSRSYSISSSPTEIGHLEITPKRVPSGLVSQYLNDQARAGLVVAARGPFGKFFFDETRHRRIVLIAGGSGITPMMSMLRYIDSLCLYVDCTLIYCVRKEEGAFFLDELHILQRRFSNFHIVFVLSQPGPAGKAGRGTCVARF